MSVVKLVDGETQTYIKPRDNRKNTDSFVFFSIFKFQNKNIGSEPRNKSVTVPIVAVTVMAFWYTCPGIQVPLVPRTAVQK